MMDVPYLSKKHIEEKANSILMELGITNGVVDPFDVLAFLEDRDGVRYEYVNFRDSNILGCLDWKKKLIFLNWSIKGNPIEKHTTIHEVGHWDTQGYLLHNTQQLSFFPQTEIRCSLRDIEGTGTFKREEWQANYYAGCLNMQKESFLNEFWKYRNQPFYPANERDLQNDEQYLFVVNRMAKFFKCSKASVKVRMKELNLIQSKVIPLF
jgi:hypothetical protein